MVAWSRRAGLSRRRERPQGMEAGADRSRLLALVHAGKTANGHSPQFSFGSGRPRGREGRVGRKARGAYEERRCMRRNPGPPTCPLPAEVAPSARAVRKDLAVRPGRHRKRHSAARPEDLRTERETPAMPAGGSQTATRPPAPNPGCLTRSFGNVRERAFLEFPRRFGRDVPARAGLAKSRMRRSRATCAKRYRKKHGILVERFEADELFRIHFGRVRRETARKSSFGTPLSSPPNWGGDGGSIEPSGVAFETICEDCRRVSPRGIARRTDEDRGSRARRSRLRSGRSRHRGCAGFPDGSRRF